MPDGDRKGNATTEAELETHLTEHAPSRSDPDSMNGRLNDRRRDCLPERAGVLDAEPKDRLPLRPVPTQREDPLAPLRLLVPGIGRAGERLTD